MRTDFWGQNHPNEWVVFHDESMCKEEGFLYHGFLFVSRSEGRVILDRLFRPYPEMQRDERNVHFNELRGAGTVSSMLARHWINLCKEEWLVSGAVKFYLIGIDFKKINPRLYKKYSEDKVYVRFYEIGLKSAVGWFRINNAQISHLYYDQGKNDASRFAKSADVLGSSTRIEALASDYSTSKNEMSKFLQLTDVLLGTSRKTFCSIGKNAGGQKRCVEIFYDVITRFNNRGSAYNPRSRYWKNFGMTFFPSSNNITPEEFVEKNIEYHKKTRDLFFCDRPTFEEKQSLSSQMNLGF